MITPKFRIKDVAKDGSAVLVEDITGSGSLYPNTGYGTPNMANADFDRIYMAINRYDPSGTSIATYSASIAPPAEKILTGLFTDGVYNLNVRIGASSTTDLLRYGSETHKMSIPDAPAGVTQLDMNFVYVTDSDVATPVWYKVASIEGLVVTFETPAPDVITTPVYWYSTDAAFLVEQDTLEALANYASCNCDCNPKVTLAYCALVQARLLTIAGDPYKAYQRFMYANNLILSL